MKRTLLLTAALLSAAWTVTPPAHAQIGPVGTLAAGAAANLTVGSILDKLETSANRILEDATNAGRVVSFNAATQAIAVIGALRQTLGGTVNQTIDQVNLDVFNALNNAAYVLQLGFDGAQATLDQSEDVINQVANLTSKLPFAQQQASVSSYRAVLLNAALTNGQTDLSFKGSGLSYGKVKLSIKGPDGQEIYSVTQNPTTAQLTTFSIPGDKLPFDRTKSTFMKVDLTYQEPGGFLKKLKERTFRFNYMLLPELLGTATFTTTYGNLIPQAVARREWVHINAQGSCTDFTFAPIGEGHKVPVQPTFSEVSERDGRGEIKDWDAESGRFIVHVCANGHTQWFKRYDGWFHAYVNWTENWSVRETKREVLSSEVRFLGDTAFDVKDPGDVFFADLTTFDGGKYTISAPSRTEAYFTSTYDPGSKKLIISANTTRLKRTLGY